MRLFAGLLLVVSSGCADYQFTVNERVVYTPAPLFSGYEIADTALLECVKAHIQEAQVTAADQLEVLNCSHAGIEDLSGLQVFAQLTRVKLSSNAIEEVNALADMTALLELYLDDNKLRSVTELRDLLELRMLDVAGNAALRCGDLTAFRNRSALELVAPEHCQAGEP
ncbi:MAG: hypothetical protein V2I66_05255 [Halieaceae bacterium]|jgi:Leucine-rich repeat (LRR) protein|nr:hypothetical protein [Halieaceae bacterium]